MTTVKTSSPVILVDDTAAHGLLASVRWPNGVTCAHCGSDKVGGLTCGVRKVWNCKTCRRQFTVRIGTVFEDSHLPLHKWFYAVVMMTSSTNAVHPVRASELMRGMGVTYKAAWSVRDRLKKALRDDSPHCGLMRTLGGVLTYLHSIQ